VAELMMSRRDAGGRDVELSNSTVALEVELQQRAADPAGVRGGLT
jgi:hypothetical protein